jgi:hypothetical protein
MAAPKLAPVLRRVDNQTEKPGALLRKLGTALAAIEVSWAAAIRQPATRASNEAHRACPPLLEAESLSSGFMQSGFHVRQSVLWPLQEERQLEIGRT